MKRKCQKNSFILAEGLLALTLVTGVAVFELETFQQYHQRLTRIQRKNRSANQAKRQALERWQLFVEQNQEKVQASDVDKDEITSPNHD